jgi:formyltetrahydrofolate deformylase
MEYVLTLSCEDRAGIVHAVAAYLHESRCNILDSQQFADRIAGRFFMRVHVETLSGAREDLGAGFSPIAATFGMEWALNDTAARPRTLVVGNHPDLSGLAEAHGVPFELAAGSMEHTEARLLDLVNEQRIDLVVLARYMRILSPGFCEKLPGRIINIHHSFLPSFKGARPYHQAHDRGVKLIGATAHYVTADLDEGPIIEQEVVRVDHTYSPADLAAVGRDAERIALARAVRWHAEHRVLLHGHRTVVFR